MKKLITLTLLLSTLLASLAGCSKANGGDAPQTTEAGTTDTEIVIDPNAWYLSSKPKYNICVMDEENNQVIDPDLWFMAGSVNEEYELYVGFPAEYVNVPEKYKSYAVKLPLTHTEEHGGFTYKIEFFQEYYLLGTLVQARISITNNTENDVKYQTNEEMAGIFMYSSYFYTINMDERTDWFEDTIYSDVLLAKETLVLERFYLTGGEIFTRALDYSYVFKSPVFGDDHIIDIPIEIVDLGK